tara:strand:+ start:1335 stop:2462 length:1128 start_codon:yes stop_codon:yes gene_type:complete
LITNIPDTNKQHSIDGMNKISWWRTSFGVDETESLKKAVINENIGEGLLTRQLEEQIAKSLDVPFVVMTTSGSVALLLSLMALGIGRDNEVILPNRTWIATAHAVLMTGAKVVLVDVLPDIPVMDVSKIREKITSRTKAIIPVHLNGRSVDMSEVYKIANEYGLFVVEDAAQALFSKNSMGYIGTHSEAGCFSLSLAKIISTGQGGFIVTRSEEIYQRLKLTRTHGVSDVINSSYTHMGFNFKFTDLQAAVGLVQLARVPKRISHLKEVYEQYSSEIKKFSFLDLIPIDISCGEVPLYVDVLCNKRESLISFLASKGIQTRPAYPNLNSASYLGIDGDFPNSRTFETQGLFLPCGPEQSFANVESVIEMLRLFGK